MKPHTNLFEACALLHADRNRTFAAHAEALVRCLNEALGCRAIFFRPGTTDISFDEAWLMRLVECERRGDESSISLLLGRRVARENRRLIRYLTAQISNCAHSV
ncbi:MAG: hypothetical protein AAFQ66_19955 [Pseudomonadota bacterium]